MACSNPHPRNTTCRPLPLQCAHLHTHTPILGPAYPFKRTRPRTRTRPRSQMLRFITSQRVTSGRVMTAHSATCLPTRGAFRQTVSRRAAQPDTRGCRQRAALPQAERNRLGPVDLGAATCVMRRPAPVSPASPPHSVQPTLLPTAPRVQAATASPWRAWRPQRTAAARARPAATTLTQPVRPVDAPQTAHSLFGCAQPATALPRSSTRRHGRPSAAGNSHVRTAQI